MIEKKIFWATDILDVSLIINEDGNACILDILPHGVQHQASKSPYFEEATVPLLAIRVAGEGSEYKNSGVLLGSPITRRLKYVSHDARRLDDGTYVLDIAADDEVTGLSAKTTLTVFPGIPVVRFSTTVTNRGHQAITLTQAASAVIGGLTTREKEWWNSYTVSTANNSWFREVQWRHQTLPDVGVDDFGVAELGSDRSAYGVFALSNRGTWSTGAHLPMGYLQRNDGGETWLWQIEHNGSWRWELGDWKDSVYLAATGPESKDHGWVQPLAPGQTFTTVPAAVSHILDGYEAAFGALTAYRRRLRRRHQDNDNMSLIFNDYMNCLMGDPDEQKVLALVQPALDCGAEYFVIDAGWYADDGNWWDDVGFWEPSTKRFPSGFDTLLRKIRANGLIPGLWMEPEVIGVRCEVANQLPKDAFFIDADHKLIERKRYQLDFRHPLVRERMHGIICKLVKDYGVGYFKFDYNIEVVSGTTANAPSPGAGQLDHNRAYLSWVNEVFDRHPGLVIESCSSGAARMDYAMLATHSLQSTSDQQDPVRYAAIAAAAPTAVTPEQSATWAYPQKSWPAEMNALTVVNSLLGRVHLSGRLDELEAGQLKLIKDGMTVYKEIRGDLKTALPFWPLGLPKWHDQWLALGLVAARKAYLAVWRRGGDETVTLPLTRWKGTDGLRAVLLYPASLEADAKWDGQEGNLHVWLPSSVSARLFRLDLP